MCGRYTLATNPLELQRALNLDAIEALEPRYNIAPTQAAPIITHAAPRKLTLARWGLLPRWAKSARLAAKTINARAETLAEKASFKQALRDHRCLVPCDGFYEWKKHGAQRTPLNITASSGRVLTMAGLWSTWRSPEGLDVVTFTIITTDANEFMAPIHDRMPAFLEAGDRARWLSGPAQDTAGLLELLRPWRGEPLKAVEVSSKVNSVAVDDPSCLAPATSVQLTLL